MRNWQFFFGIGILLCSCNLADDRLEQTLSEAGDNRRELEKVLNHYTGNDSDPEKYEAGKIHGNRVVFSDMGRQVVYLPVLYQSQKIIPIVPPLLLDSNGTTRLLVPSRELLETVHLTRKYPVFDWWNTRTQALKGGKFQAVNNAGFSPSHDLYVIDSVPEMTYHDILIDTSKRYRYFRYLAPDSTQGDIAEIETYDENGQTLAGTVIGTTVGDSNPNTRERAFDGEALTYFQGDSTHNNWVGLAFESPKSIKKIRF
ncbi:hypothetical protein [Parapedobacter indicus]|uniref:Uncharacterized protein n=1 Tax=Parapedobacter indicus TaxID=1477437 RepID=A0A1I3SS18_9SPHI|nr:hypothetical protein [Parapedobacter indicus]PPK99747.1 hypothetical protein CLV26_11180 [Parapedobacter indicus]SFJ60226.1 hypothetical protein SAMN05444682_111119 [Parapedobacter indicus]